MNGKIQVIISLDEEKLFHKIQYTFMEKELSNNQV
jgi:hypothetical protein